MRERPLTREEDEREVAFKVVKIMQTIAEDLDDSGKKAWRKMLGMSNTTEPSPDTPHRRKTEDNNQE